MKNAALLTDLYELTMLAAYIEHGMEQEAVFEFFVRSLPVSRNFLIAAGLSQVVEYLQTLAFSAEDLAWLASTGRFSKRFLQWLADFRFRGEVHAVPEGTLVFADEPLIRITAPLPQAQFIESRLINIVNHQTMVASKAIRSRIAAGDKQLIDFGLRRAHGFEGALMSARASYIGLFDGTSNVLAAQQFGIPLFGTMAHSFIEACEGESQAFLRYATTHPKGPTFLIDTYDTESGARHVVALMEKLKAMGATPAAVRLDSGNLAKHARAVRQIFDEAQASEVRIFASGNLDEHAIAHLIELDAPIDGFGVGTRMNVSADAPYLDCAYKLQHYAGAPRRKRSSGKATWPGAKQIWRSRDADGKFASDHLTLHTEAFSGEPLVKPILRAGNRVAEEDSLDVIRDRVRNQLASLPRSYLSLDAHQIFPVTISKGIEAAAHAADARAAIW
ncbi:MAG: Nicotinate phosphoribosyltransferase [Pseudomonadota bacterium]|jgi:nicotinate phosphoribosyltransferase